MLDLLDDRGAAVESFRNLVDYTPYAFEFRYVGVDPYAEPIDREGAIALVEALLERVGRRLAEAEADRT